MKKLAISVLLLLIITGFNQLKAQKDRLKEDFYDGEFFLADEDYKDALYSFQKVYNAGYQENANVNYRIGVCYSSIPGQKAKAIPYLLKAVQNISENYKEGNFNETVAPPDAWLYLGNVYRIDYQLDKSIDAYNQYIKLGSKVSALDIEFAKQQIASCNRAKVGLKNPSPIFKENIGKKYNTSLNNFQAVYAGDENSMAYMTAQKFYDAVYFVKKVNGKWLNAVNITPQIESDGNQYVSSLSFDGSKLFLVRIDNFDGDIMISDYSMGRWNPSRSIGKPINSKFFESHACLSADGKILYFTSNRTGGKGGMDIFSSKLKESGEWSEPVNLGDNINTPLNEESPFISVDGKTLYFSSQGHSTIGGYDVFTSELQADNTWSAAVPLPYPLNTTDDDLFFFPDSAKKGIYTALYDDGGLGEGDIYYIKIITEEELAMKAAEVAPEEQVVAEVTPEETEVEEIVEEVPEVAPPSVRFTIKPIFFAFDSYAVTDYSKEKLSSLVDALKEYPLLNLEISGYTDAIGSYEYNQILSDKRAKAVTNYLVVNGIDSNRLRTVGYSESRNVALNTLADGRDSQEGRKFNRRVEFHIVDLGGALLKIEEAPVPEQIRVK